MRFAVIGRTLAGSVRYFCTVRGSQSAATAILRASASDKRRGERLVFVTGGWCRHFVGRSSVVFPFVTARMPA